MAYIQLTKGKQALVDDDLLESLLICKWHYANVGYPATRVANKIVYMHQLILGKPPAGMLIDHINRDKLDNRKNNLRIVTHQESLMNRSVTYGRTKGVSVDRTFGKYKAYYDVVTLGQPKRRVNIGTFKTMEEAIAARAAWMEQNNVTDWRSNDDR